MLNSLLYSQGFRLVPTNSRPLLLYRPIPDAKEGFGEYLTRLCSGNCLDGPAALAERLGLTYGQLIELGSENFREILCGRTALVSPRPGKITGVLHGKKYFWRGVRTQARVCPQCLSEGNVADKSWSWPLTLACDQHGSWLLDRCPRCSQEISLLRRRQFACNCGYDYRLAQVRQAEHWLGDFYKFFSPERFGQPQDRGAIFESDQMAQLILRALLKSDKNPPDARQRRLRGPTVTLVRADQIVRLREMMLHWSTWISQRMECIADAHPQSAERLIRQMRALGSTELLAVAAKSTDAIEGKKKAGRLQKELEAPRIRSIEELSRVTGLNERTIKSFIAKGYINGCTTQERYPGRNSYLISEEESARIRLAYESSLSLSEAAHWFDSDALHVKIFAKANFLKPVLNYSNQVVTWRFCKEDLDSFLNSLKGIASTVANDAEPAELAPLGMLPIKHHSGCPNRNWIRLAGRIASGEIPIFRLNHGRGLNALAVRTSDLSQRGRR